MKEITITVNPDGTSSIAATGFVGPTCSLATRELELVLAGDASNVDDKKDPSYWQQLTPTQKLGG